MENKQAVKDVAIEKIKQLLLDFTKEVPIIVPEKKTQPTDIWVEHVDAERDGDYIIGVMGVRFGVYIRYSGWDQSPCEAYNVTWHLNINDTFKGVYLDVNKISSGLSVELPHLVKAILLAKKKYNIDVTNEDFIKLIQGNYGTNEIVDQHHAVKHGFIWGRNDDTGQPLLYDLTHDPIAPYTYTNLTEDSEKKERISDFLEGEIMGSSIITGAIHNTLSYYGFMGIECTAINLSGEDYWNHGYGLYNDINYIVSNEERRVLSDKLGYRNGKEIKLGELLLLIVDGNVSFYHCGVDDSKFIELKVNTDKSNLWYPYISNSGSLQSTNKLQQLRSLMTEAYTEIITNYRIDELDRVTAKFVDALVHTDNVGVFEINDDKNFDHAFSRRFTNSNGIQVVFYRHDRIANEFSVIHEEPMYSRYNAPDYTATIKSLDENTIRALCNEINYRVGSRHLQLSQQVALQLWTDLNHGQYVVSVVNTVDHRDITYKFDIEYYKTLEDLTDSIREYMKQTAVNANDGQLHDWFPIFSNALTNIKTLHDSGEDVATFPLEVLTPKPEFENKPDTGPMSWFIPDYKENGLPF